MEEKHFIIKLLPLILDGSILEIIKEKLLHMVITHNCLAMYWKDYRNLCKKINVLLNGKMEVL
jgi:hypothetical protein